MKVAELKKKSIAELEELIPTLEGETQKLAVEILEVKKKREEPDAESPATIAEEASKAKEAELLAKEEAKEKARQEREAAAKEREEKRMQAKKDREEAKRKKEAEREAKAKAREEEKILKEKEKEEAMRAREEAKAARDAERANKVKELAGKIKFVAKEGVAMTKADMVRKGMSEGLNNRQIADTYGLTIKFVCDTAWRIERQLEQKAMRERIRREMAEKYANVTNAKKEQSEETDAPEGEQ